VSVFVSLCEPWRNPQNRKYITYCIVVRTGPSHGQSLTHIENFVKCWHVFRHALRQSDVQTSSSQYVATYWREAINFQNFWAHCKQCTSYFALLTSRCASNCTYDCRLTMKQTIRQSGDGEFVLPMLVESCRRRLHFNLFFNTASRKKEDTILLPVTLPSVVRFS